MSRRKKSTLPHAVQQQLDQIVVLPPLKCQEDERPPVILTPAAIVELRDHAPTLAIPVLFEEGKYDCPFCNSECTRDYCYACHSELLEDDIETE